MMSPGASAGGSAGHGSPEDLAAAMLAAIAGGDLPGGADLNPERLAVLFTASEPDVRHGLKLLETLGAAVAHAGGWRVAAGRNGRSADILHWLVPLLRSIVSLAVARITPAEAAGLLAAYDRYAGLSGDGTVRSRADGYRLLMERLATASGSRFHESSLHGRLSRAGPFLERMVTHQMASRHRPEPDDELGRLAQAMMQQNAVAATAALEDHLILLRRYLDCPEPIRP